MAYIERGKHGSETHLVRVGSDAAFIDCETSGLDPKTTALLSVAVVRVEGGEIVDEWSSRVRMRSDKVWEMGAERVHGISQSEAWRAPPFEDVLPDFRRALGGLPPAAQYAPFDAGFLEKAFEEQGVAPPWRENDWICTKVLSNLTWGGGVRHGLDDIAERLGLGRREGHHDALSDARLTAQCWLHWPKNGFGV